MKYILISVIGWLAAFTCLGQDAIKKNALSLSFGPGYLMRQDLIFSPFTHTDLSVLNIGLDYTREARLFQKISLRYGNFDPMVANPYDFTVHGETETAYPHSFNFIKVSYLIGKKVRQTEKSTLVIAGLFTTDVQAMNYAYGRISSFGYYSAIGLGISGKYKVAINEKSSLAATLQLPLLSWLARPPYMGIDDEFIQNISSHSGFKTFMAFNGDGELVTWNRLQTFDLGLEYTYHLSEKWDVGAAYLFEFIHASQPRPLLSYRNAVNLSITVKF